MPNECRLLATQLSNLHIRHKAENEKIQAEIKQLKTDFPHLFQSVETEALPSKGNVLQLEDAPASPLGSLVNDIKVIMLMRFSVPELKEFLNNKKELRDKDGGVIISQKEAQKLVPRVLQMKYQLFNDQGSLADLGINNLDDAAEALTSLPTINENALKQFLGIAPDSDVRTTLLYMKLKSLRENKNQLQLSQQKLDQLKIQLTNLKASTAALTNTSKARLNWIRITGLENQIPFLKRDIAQNQLDLEESQSNLLRVLRQPFGFDRMRHVFGGRAAFEALPILDLTTCERFNKSDYIDFVLPKDMSAPIMRGVDYFKRNFIAIKFIPPHQTKPKVMTIHERYTRQDIWYANGADSFVELADYIYGNGSFQTRENDFVGETTNPEIFFKQLIKEVTSSPPTV